MTEDLWHSMDISLRCVLLASSQVAGYVPLVVCSLFHYGHRSEYAATIKSLDG